MLTLISSLKLITEVALLSLVGQWVLGILVGQRREHNVVYQLLQKVASPFVFAAAWVTPKLVQKKHLPWVAFLLLVLAWMGLTGAKLAHCLEIGIQLCK